MKTKSAGMKTTIDASEPPGVPLLHYLILGYLSLAAALLAQFQQGYMLSNLLTLGYGVLGIIGRIRVAPLIFLLLVAADQVIEGDPSTACVYAALLSATLARPGRSAPLRWRCSASWPRIIACRGSGFTFWPLTAPPLRATGPESCRISDLRSLQRSAAASARKAGAARNQPVASEPAVLGVWQPRS